MRAGVRRFRSKPWVIEAVEFEPGMELPAGVEVDVVLEVGEDPRYLLRNLKHDSWIGLKPGDFIRLDMAPEDVYPIDAEYMARQYTEVGG